MPPSSDLQPQDAKDGKKKKKVAGPGGTWRDGVKGKPGPKKKIKG